MKEFDESEAIALMLANVPEEKRDEDAACEVLDLIYDYYEENGDLDIDADDDDADTGEIVAYVSRMLSRNPAAVVFTDAELQAMVEAEIEYENSLF